MFLANKINFKKIALVLVFIMLLTSSMLFFACTQSNGYNGCEDCDCVYDSSSYCSSYYSSSSDYNSYYCTCEGINGLYALVEGSEFSPAYIIIYNGTISIISQLNINSPRFVFSRKFEILDCGLYYKTGAKERYIDSFSFRKEGCYLYVTRYSYLRDNMFFIMRRDNSRVFNNNPLESFRITDPDFTQVRLFEQGQESNFIVRWHSWIFSNLFEYEVAVKRESDCDFVVVKNRYIWSVSHEEANFEVGLNTVRVTNFGGPVLYNNEIRIMQDYVKYVSFYIKHQNYSITPRVEGIAWCEDLPFETNIPARYFYALRFYSEATAHIERYVDGRWIFHGFAWTQYRYANYFRPHWVQLWYNLGKNKFRIIAQQRNIFWMCSNGDIHTGIYGEPFYFTIYFRSGYLEILNTGTM